MLTERSIINFLVWIVGMIVGPYLAVSAVEFNFIPAGVFAGACVVFVLFRYLRDAICLLPVIGTFFTGKFNFIPVLHPAPTELLPLMLIFYYFIAYTALQRKRMLTGPLYFFVPIMVIGLLVFYHEHNFSLRSLGGGREGARGAIFVMVAVVAYLCGVSVASPSPRFLYWTPVLCVFASLVSAIPYTVTTYFPNTAPYFYIFTDNINGGAYTSVVLDKGDIVRNQGQATVGAAVVTLLLAYFPIQTWWRPNRWWVLVLALACVPLVLMSGFRSVMFNFALVIIVAAWCQLSWRSLLLIPVFALGILSLVFLQNSHAVNLPLSVQRSIAFLPGDWDPEVAQSAVDSNEFRKRIIDVYLEEDATKSPLLGNGLSYDKAEFENYNYLAYYHETRDMYYSTKIYITGKMFHTGWISLYDSIGLVGFAAFLFFFGSFIWVSGTMALGKGADRNSMLFPLKVWILCNVLPNFIGYFTVYGDVKTMFTQYCYFAVLLVHVMRVEKFGYWAAVPVRQVPFDPSRTDRSAPAPA